MGCDIHTFVEVNTGDGWFLAGQPLFKNWQRRALDNPSQYDTAEWLEDIRRRIEKDPDYGMVSPSYAAGDYRSYDTFAVLANVRNGNGFAGCDTGDALPVIAQPRGLPDDCCDEVLEMNDVWEKGDGHSHSHLTLAEILNWDEWKVRRKKRGWVSLAEYKTWKESGENSPIIYSGGIFGANIVKVSESTMQLIIDEGTLGNPDDSYYCQVEWEESIADLTTCLSDITIPVLQDIARHYEVDDDKVRLVFWFDN